MDEESKNKEFISTIYFLIYLVYYPFQICKILCSMYGTIIFDLNKVEIRYWVRHIIPIPVSPSPYIHVLELFHYRVRCSIAWIIFSMYKQTFLSLCHIFVRRIIPFSNVNRHFCYFCYLQHCRELVPFKRTWS